MSKYSALTRELTEINLCLRNLDGTPQSTNQSHQADQTVHAINTHPAPGVPTGTEVGFVCLFTCLCAPKAVEEIVFRNVLWALLKGHHIPGFQQSYKELIRGSLLAAKPPALSAVCKGWEANQPRGERTEPGTDVGPGDIIRLLPEQTDPSGRELGLGGVSVGPGNSVPLELHPFFLFFCLFFQNFIGV